MKKTVSDQIKDLENTRAAKVARQESIMEKSMNEGRSTDADEGQEFDEIELDVKGLDADLVRLRTWEKRMVEQAKSVDGATADKGTASRGTVVSGGMGFVRKHNDKEDAFQGQSFVRKIIAQAAAELKGTHATNIAMERWGQSNPTLVNIIKVGEVPGGGSGSGEWGAELAAADSRYTGDFVEFLYGATLFDKLPLRVAPDNVMVKGQDGAATGYWVGESKAIPATAMDFMDFKLEALKAAALAVVSNDLIRKSSPDAEQMVRDALVSASAQRVDLTFLSAVAGVAGVSPAGLLNGVTGITASGTDSDALRADIKALYAPFIAARNAAGIHLVTNTSLAKSISLMTNALGQYEFATLNTSGGTLLGDPAHVGDNVGATHLIALKPSDIYKIGQRGVEVSLSREAMVEQNVTPTGATDTPVAASATMVSMFQTDSTAIKVIRPIAFAKRRASAVQFITGAAYV